MAVARKRKAVKTGGAGSKKSAVARKPRSVRAQVSREEWETRVNLAACYRLIALNGMDDLLATHISARVPGKEEHFLINPYGLLFSQVTASNLVKVDLAGNIVSDSEWGINPAGFVIHSAIHGARPDVVCIIHTHTIAGMAVACLEEGLMPLSQKSLRFYNRIAYHDYEGKSDDLDERGRLVRDIGVQRGHLIRGRGGLRTEAKFVKSPGNAICTGGLREILSVVGLRVVDGGDDRGSHVGSLIGIFRDGPSPRRRSVVRSGQI